MPKADIKRYWSSVADLGCVISRMPAEIAHTHGGSMIQFIGPHAKGKKIPRFHWLVLPLAPEYHRDVYPEGLDRNVWAWEAKYGTQVEHLDVIAERLGVDIWSLAGVNRKEAA